MADDRGHRGRPAERPGSRDLVREHCQEKMGCQLCFHGSLRLCSRDYLLGDMGLQHVIRRKASALLGQSSSGFRPTISLKASGAAGYDALFQKWDCADGLNCAVFSYGVDGLVSMRVCVYYSDFIGGFVVGEDEY